MKIDGNELAILQNDLDRRGQKQEAWKVKQEFLKQVRESGDHCPCQGKCPHHGNCFECVTLHRGHRDHLPMCMWDMVNERLHQLSRLRKSKQPVRIARAAPAAANEPKQIIASARRSLLRAFLGGKRLPLCCIGDHQPAVFRQRAVLYAPAR